MTIFDNIATKIIKEQELIIGPLAWDEAKKGFGRLRLYIPYATLSWI